MFTDIFGNAPRVRLLDFLADNPEFDYTISQMEELAEIARPTVYKLIEELLVQNLLTFTRSVGDSKFYRLNVANPRIVSMLQVDFEGINRELAAGVYDGMPDSPEGPEKSRAGSRLQGRPTLQGRVVPIRAYSRRAVRRKKPKSSD